MRIAQRRGRRAQNYLPIRVLTCVAPQSYMAWRLCVEARVLRLVSWTDGMVTIKYGLVLWFGVIDMG